MSSALNGHTDWKSIKIRTDRGRKRGEKRDEVIKGERERNHKSRYTKLLNE